MAKVTDWAQPLPPLRPRARVALMKLVMQRDGKLCWICKAPCSKKDRTLDHVRPIALGGDHRLSNLRLAHQKCNEARGCLFKRGCRARPKRTKAPLWAR